MFELRPFDGNIRILDHRSFELCSSLRNIEFWSGTAFKSVQRQLQGILVSLYRIVQELLLGVSAAQLKIVECKFGVKTKADSFEVARRTFTKAASEPMRDQECRINAASPPR